MGGVGRKICLRLEKKKKNGFQVRARHTNERLTERKTTKLPERGQDFSCLPYNKESWYFLSM